MTWSVDELATLAAKTNPDARLISRQLLRNILRAYSGYPGLGWNLPHDHMALLPGGFLRDLGVFAANELPTSRGPDQWILLIAQPTITQTRTWNRSQALTWLWRQLFHGRVHASARRAKVAGVWDDDRTEEMVREIGGLEFREVRTVLLEENLIGRETEPGEVLEEFLAVLLELLAFDTTRVPEWFPLLEPAKIRGLVSLLGTPGEMLAATRPEGAVHPGTEAAALANETFIPSDREYDGKEYDIRWRLARQMEADGKEFEALLAFWDAAHVEPTRSRGKMHRLAWQRLSQCLGIQSETIPDWALAWIDKAYSQRDSEGPAHRALKAVFHAHTQMAQNPTELCPWTWLLSFGSKPFRRELPGVSLLAARSELTKAKTLIYRSELKIEWIREIEESIEHFQHSIEHKVAEFFRPVFHNAFEMAGFHPVTKVETAALNTVVEEMIARLLDTRQLSLGDIRDILARNHLKLADVGGPLEWLRGDKLMALDRALGQIAPGAYRRGEFYIRELQRLSSLFYATSVGRLVLLWFILPFLITLVLWKFPQFMHEEILKFGGTLTRNPTLYDSVLESEKESLPVYDPANWLQPVLASVEDFTNHKGEEESRLVLGSPPFLALTFIYILLLIQSPLVRAWSLSAFNQACKWVRFLLWEGPLMILAHPLVKRFLELPPIRWFWTIGLKPALLSAIVYWLASTYLNMFEVRPIVRVGFFLVFMAVFASRYWIRAEAWIWDVFGEFMQDLGIQSLYRLGSLILWVARLVVDWISLTILKVTEWLRPNPNSTGISLVFKAGLAMILMPLMGLLRFILIVLIEPQINPIKHFPTVTIGHKFMLVLIVPFAQKLESMGINWEVALTISVGIITGIPGFFGFMVWELMENWRLYAANRPERLCRVRIGSHGESFYSFFRPGFHSGTIAKAFRKLRHSTGVKRLRLASDLDHHRHSLVNALDRNGNAMVQLGGGAAPFALKKVGVRGIRVQIQETGKKSVPLIIEVISGRVWSWVNRDYTAPPLVAKSLEGLDAAFGVQIQAKALEPGMSESWETDGRFIRVKLDGQWIQYDLDSSDQPLLPHPETPKAGPINLDEMDCRQKTPLWKEWVSYWGNCANSA